MKDWERLVREWKKIPPYPRESVVITNFWQAKIVFHRRFAGPESDGLGGTVCDPRNTRRATPCGHAMPVEVAMKIAVPCRRCWPR
jgi:hypothetical protein